MDQPGPKWLMQITPTDQGFSKYPNWGDHPGSYPIYDEAERDDLVESAVRALDCGDISVFRIDPV